MRLGSFKALQHSCGTLVSTAVNICLERGIRPQTESRTDSQKKIESILSTSKTDMSLPEEKARSSRYIQKLLETVKQIQRTEQSPL